MRRSRAEACGLVAADARVQLAAAAPRGWRVVERWLALPSAARADVLVPPDRRAGAAALRRFANGSSGRVRLRTAVAAAALAGGAGPLIRGRIAVAVDPSVTDADLPDLVLTHRLRVELGDERLLVSVRLGALRPNGKPVAQAMSGDGSAAAFVKIGWNDLTRSLVRREAEQLAALWLPAPPRSFSVPRILWAGAWAGHELLAVQPAEGGPAPSQPPLAATAELAARGGLTRSALATSTWWQRVRARAGAAASGADTHRLQQAIDAVERRHGEDELVFGTAHGDWTPWNMAVRDGRLQVWDWERCATGVPVGLDIAHHLLLVALRRRRRPMPEALAETFERTPALIGQVGAEAAAGVAVVELELLEMAVRFAEARAAGVTVPHDVFLDTLLDLGNAT